jgi:phosphohistidine swiveling domain-containing protein
MLKKTDAKVAMLGTVTSAPAVVGLNLDNKGY